MRVKGVLWMLGFVAAAACGGERAEQAGTTESASAGAAPPTSESDVWSGPLSMRGTLEGGRQATGTLTVSPLEEGGEYYGETMARAKRVDPEYTGPLYSARLEILAGTERIDGSLTCAHGRGEGRPLVCEPVSPMRGLENATLVVQSNGRAMLTGSHGEGVSAEYGRFTWERSNGTTGQ